VYLVDEICIAAAVGETVARTDLLLAYKTEEKLVRHSQSPQSL
jgi:hypothetical protein